MTSSIIVFSVILLFVYVFSLLYFKKSLCDSNTRIPFICWNIIFIIIILNFFIIGSQKNKIQEEKQNIEGVREKKTNGTKVFFSILGILLFLSLSYYLVKRFLC